MSKVVLITAEPRTAAGAGVIVRQAGGGNRKGYYFQGEHWRAGVASLPRFSAAIGFDDNGWTGGVVPTTGDIVIVPSGRARLSELGAYVWRDAPVTIQVGDEDKLDFATRLDGTIVDAAVRDGKLVMTVADLSHSIAKPILTARFAGTGGAEGGAEADGRIKRRSWGAVFNVEGRILDKANNIYEFGDPAFPWQAFATLRDKGREAAPAPAIVAWQGSIAATLAALVAAVPVQGSGVVAPSIACAKWWTQPAGPLTADIEGEIGAGYVDTAPAIAERILQAFGGPAVTNIAAMVAARPGRAGLHVDEGETIAAALDRLLLGVSLLWIVNPTGTITLREFSFAGPIETLRSDKIERVRTLPPVKARRLAYQVSNRVHSDGEIAGILLVGDISGLGSGATANSLADLDAAANDILLSTARPGQNVLYNGSLKLGFAGWNSGGFGYAADWRGNIVQQPIGTGGVFVMQSTRPINSGPNEPVVVSAQFTGTASPNAFVFVDIEWRNGGNGATIAFSSDTPGQNGVLFRDQAGSRIRKYQPLMSPSSTDGSGFVRGYVRVVGINDVAYADSTRWTEQIKVERGAVPTPFSDEATNGADVGNAVGRFDSGTYLPTNWNIGIKSLNLTGFPLSDSDAGGSVIINIAATPFQLDDGRIINYPVGALPGHAYGTIYFIWRLDPLLNGGTNFGSSTDIRDALGPGKVYYGFWTTRATAGGTGGGGGGGIRDCIAHGMHVLTERGAILAEQAGPKDRVRTLGADLHSLDWTSIESNEAHENECVTIRTRLGAELTLALNTPCVTESGGWVMAANAWMVRLPVLARGELVWDDVVAVDYAGRRPVAAIRCHNATYAAGADPDLLILTHNPAVKP